jgi:heat shock protein HtpX
MNNSQLRLHRLGNHFQAFVLILGMALIMSVVGYSLAGRTGVWFAITFSAISAMIGPTLSPKFVLQMHRARPLDPRQAPGLHDVFSQLVQQAGLAHEPTLYYVPSGTLNAFAVGADRTAVVAVTDGLLRTLSPRELSGVLAHELSHLRFGDTHLMALGDVFSRMTASMSQIGQLLLILLLPAAIFGAPFISFGGLMVLCFAPLACALLQLALSRSREFNADLGAIELTSDPLGMATALEKLERAQQGGWLRRLFFPYRSLGPSFLRTHPATEERIERLRQMAGNSTPTIPSARYGNVAAAMPLARQVELSELLSRVRAGILQRLAG